MIEFLTSMWGLAGPQTTSYGELRIMHAGTVEQEFYIGSMQEVVDRAIFHDQAGKDVYYGVLPRTSEQGTAASCVTSTHVLWADVDAKNFDGSKAAALFALGRADLSPSILVDSGNGFHAYWLLQERVPFADASGVMRGLAKAIGGDSVHDASRVLRLPGTHNFKTDPPHPVRLLHFEPDRRYRFSDFDAYAPQPVERRESVNLEDPLPYAELPDWLRELVARGAPQGTRSEQAFKVCVWLLRFGWNPVEIHSLFVSPTGRVGIGQKMARMRWEAGERWLERTIHAAQESA